MFDRTPNTVASHYQHDIHKAFTFKEVGALVVGREKWLISVCAMVYGGDSNWLQNKQDTT